MSKKQDPSEGTQPVHMPLKRRQALQGLGLLATTAPVLGVVACGNDSNGQPSGEGGKAAGGATGSSGSGGSGMGGSGMGGAQNGGAPGNGGAQNGGAPGNGGAQNGGAPGNGGATTANGGAAAGGKTGGDAGAAAGGKASGGAGGAGGVNAGGGSGGTGGGTLTAPPWTNVPIQEFPPAKPNDMPKALACNVVTKRDGAGQGPFFIHDEEKTDDVSLRRQDIRGRYNESAAAGVDMELHVRLIDKAKSDAACTMLVPVPDIDVYIWHTDAQGFYSGFGKRGTSTEQKPDAPYAGSPNSMNLEVADRFCRGLQTTNSDGVVSYKTVYPGWYNGRVLHIHIVCFKKGSKSHGRVDYTKSNEPMWVFTTQFYFPMDFTKTLHEKYEPYKSRINIAGYQNMITPGAGSNGNGETNFSGRECTVKMDGDKVIAQLQLVVDPA